MADLDLLEYLSADHQNLASAESDSLVVAATEHLTVERDLLYPLIRTYVTNGESTVDELRAAARMFVERLAALDDHPSPEHEDQVRAAMREHIEGQERLFPELREGIPADRLRELVEEIPLSIGGAPTHPHPHMFDSGPIGGFAEGLASVTDHIRDRLHGGKRD